MGRAEFAGKGEVFLTSLKKKKKRQQTNIVKRIPNRVWSENSNMLSFPKQSLVWFRLLLMQVKVLHEQFLSINLNSAEVGKN